VESPLEERRSRRVYILWGISLTLLVAAGLFCWLVVVPVMEVLKAVKPVGSVYMLWWHDEDEIFPNANKWQDDANLSFGIPPTSRKEVMPIIEQLGGQVSAARKLNLFLRLPTWLTGADKVPDEGNLRSMAISYADRAAFLLCYCGEPAVPELLSLTDHPDRGVRLWVTSGLASIRPQGPEVTAVLKMMALKDEDETVRQAAAEALRRIKTAQEKDK